LGIIGAVLTVYFAYWLNKRHTKSLRQESSRILSSALTNEVNDAIERCCYIVECQAIGRISNTSLPIAAREYLLSHFSEVTIDDENLITLTKIYNILDRIITHQDEAVKLASDQNLDRAVGAQGKATAFIREYLDDLVALVATLINKEKLSQLHNRYKLIKSASSIEYLIIAKFYNQYGDTAAKKEYEGEEDNTDLVRFVVDALEQQLGRLSPMSDYDNKGKQIIETLQEKHFGISATGTKLKPHILQMIKDTSWPRFTGL